MSEKEEFEKLPDEMPKWIRDHVALCLSDPEKARLWAIPAVVHRQCQWRNDGHCAPPSGRHAPSFFKAFASNAG